MRLAVFTSQFPGRVSTFFARDMRALVEAGIDVDIFAFYPPDPSLWRYVPNILSENILPKAKIHHISLGQTFRSLRLWPLWKVNTFLRDTVAVSASAARFGVEPLAKSGYVSLKAWAWAQKFSDNYDHILAYWGNYAATCAYIFHRLIGRRIPFSLFLHAGTDLYRNQVYLKQKLLYADNIIIVCEFNRQFIRNLYPHTYHHISDKIHLYHLGLDFAEFPYKPDGRSPKKVLAVGSFEKIKGFDYLLRAISELRCKGVDIEVELVGDGKQAGPLKALASKLGIQEKLTFRGWLSFDEVRTALQQATLLVHPSTGLGDAVPTVIKEAMALGTPVIASNVVGIPELLDNARCGILVSPKDVSALANAIETLLTNAELRQTYARAARVYAEQKLDLWRNGRNLADLLRSTRESNSCKEMIQQSAWFDSNGNS
jgi:glycosyltransferase involved in cell wall biosynthesis